MTKETKTDGRARSDATDTEGAGKIIFHSGGWWRVIPLIGQRREAEEPQPR